MSLYHEFKKFAFRGNVIDLAVGVIIGGAFGQITNSLVNDIIMPPLGLLIADIEFSSLAWVLQAAEIGPQGKVVKEAVTIRYGEFLEIVLNFLIIAVAIFLSLEAIERIRDEEENKPGPTAKPQPSEQEKLLAEIRDLLKERVNPQTDEGRAT
ncbi:MAG: large-conductance mechanosensitive channel protein MscL [Catalinimonas sp.]